MASEVVPFGKYKGQPVEVLRADEDYCQWLMGQDWFRAKFTTIYQTIINYGAEPQDTPEHNEMQASFLDDERCFRLAKLLWPNVPYGPTSTARSREWREKGARFYEAFKEHLKTDYDPATITARKFEQAGWDVSYRISPAELWLEVTSLPACACGECDHATCPEYAPCWGGDLQERYCHHHDCAGRIKPTFEWADKERTRHKGFSYTLLWSWTEARKHCSKQCPWSHQDCADWLLGDIEEHRVYSADLSGRVLIELKPELGDDFPAVLRQVSSYKHEHGDRRCVVVRRASFERVTWEQVATMFAASGIKLLREAQLQPELDRSKEPR